jgi:signal transduction histidine kinase
MENDVNRLKNLLSEELAKESSDNETIARLSREITNSDKTKVRFSIDSGVIDRLGRELVARQETAVSELVKNSYDADSKLVTLTFRDSDIIGGTLVIEDDGDGMDRNELVNGFMRISSTSKVHNPYSRNYKRKRAGQKGIGRFAVQRLGMQLEIITQVENSDDALQLKIDWSKYSGDTDLMSITNSLDVIKKKRTKGTTLIIGGLRDKWSYASIKRIYRYVSDILQPFPLSKETAEKDAARKEETLDPGLKISFYKWDNGKRITVADDASMVYTHAAAIIEGHIDANSLGVYTIESKKLDINEIGEIGNDPNGTRTPFNKLKNIRFKAYYFIYDKELIPSLHLSSIQKLARTTGGIRLYRNGFRVLPYGEPGDDWLKLDSSAKTRSILPSHGNNSFFGFVELVDSSNEFNETSSREGLTENEALIQLKNFVYRTLITGVIKVAEVRNVKITTSQQQDDNGNWEKIDFRIKNVAFTLEELDKELESGTSSVEARKRRKQKIKLVKDAIEEIQKIQKSEQDKMIKERSMLRVLSSVGLTIAQFIHEIKYYMDNIQSDIRFLILKLEHNKIAIERLEILNSNFSSFHTYTSYFDEVISQNVIRELKPLNLVYLVKPFIKSIHSDANRSGIFFEEPKFNKHNLYTKSMHPSEWSSILFNFYTNAKKAIKKVSSTGKILIECGEFENMVYLEFSDTGIGISKDDEDKIFDEFFTTTSTNSFDDLTQNSEILGTGLGLKIVKDIVKSYRGNVLVVSPKENFSTCIRVEIPKATEKELNENGI